MSEYDDWLRKPEIQAAIQAGEIVAAKDSEEAIEKLHFVLHEIYPETEA
jgi:hypothetical protein